jgi:hypothetical protein
VYQLGAELLVEFLQQPPGVPIRYAARHRRLADAAGATHRFQQFQQGRQRHRLAVGLFQYPVRFDLYFEHMQNPSYCFDGFTVLA